MGSWVDTEKVVPQICLSFAEVVLRLAWSSEKKKVEKLMQIMFDAKFDVQELKRHVGGLEDCARVVMERNDKEMSKMGSTKEIVRPEGENGTSEALLYTKNVCCVLREQVSNSECGTFFCSFYNVPAEMAHPFSTQWGRRIERNMRELVMRSGRREVMWNGHDDAFPKLFAELIQIFLDKAATSLKCNSLAAYPVQVVWLNVTARQRRFLIDHGYNLIGFLLVESGAVEMEQEGEYLKERVSVYGFSSGDVVPLETPIAHTSSDKGRKERMSLLGVAMRSLLEPLRNSCETGFKVVLRSGEARNCFPVVVSYCCGIPEAKDVSTVRHGAGRYYPCVRCHIKYEDMKNGREEASHTSAATIATRQVIEKLNDSAAGMTGTEDRLRRREIGNQLKRLLSEQSLAKWPSFLEDMCVEHGLVVENLYSVFTFEPLHNLHLEVSRLLKSCLIHDLSSNEIYSHPVGPSKKQKRLSMMRTPLLKACNGMLAHIEKKYALPGLHVGFSKKERTSQLNGLFMGNGIRGMLEGKGFYAVNMVFPFIAAFIDRSLGFEKQCELTGTNVPYDDIFNKVLVDHKEKRWRREELEILRSEIKKLKEVVEGVFASQCQTGLYTLKFHLLEQLVEDLERFESLAFTDAAPFEHFIVLIKQSYRMTSRRLSTKMGETVKNMENALLNVRKPRRREIEGNSKAFDAKRRKCLERGGGYLVREGVRLSPEEISNAVKRGEEERVGFKSFGSVLFDLFKKKVLVSFGEGHEGVGS